MDWFRDKISSKFEVKFRGRFGPGVGNQKSMRILYRLVEWTETGISYDAYQRHAEIIAKHLGLEGEARSLHTESKD